jgi:hypothetical protein
MPIQCNEREVHKIPIEIRTSSHNLRQLLEYISTDFANKYYRSWQFVDGVVAVGVRDKLMLRNMQTLTITVTVEWRQNFNGVLITIIASGGREGLFRLDMWGAENGAEGWAEREIMKALEYFDGGGYTTHQSPSRRPLE